VYKGEASHDECGTNEDETIIMTASTLWPIVSYISAYVYLPAAREYSSHYSYFIYARRVDGCGTCGGGRGLVSLGFLLFSRRIICKLYMHIHTTVALCVCDEKDDAINIE